MHVDNISGNVVFCLNDPTPDPQHQNHFLLNCNPRINIKRQFLSLHFYCFKICSVLRINIIYLFFACLFTRAFRRKRPRYKFGFIETFRSTFTANRERLEVAWPGPEVTFEVLNARCRRQEVGFHLSDLPEDFLAWNICFCHVQILKLCEASLFPNIKL